MILKYFWCAGKMDNYKTVIPPSFPVDSKIINKLKKEAFDLDEKNILSKLLWTKMSKADYMYLNKMKVVERIKNENSSLSEWELNMWSE